jgi:uncharacterized protein YjgD (DUF1641 family)
MANPIAFQPKVADPRINLQRRLEAAPAEHAEALLVLWDLLQAAHDQGLLDTAHGLVTAKDTILGKLAEAAKGPEGVAAIRNGIALVEVIASLDPEVLDGLVKAITAAGKEHEAEVKPPSLWELAKRAMSEDSRRGLSFMTLMLQSVGRSLKR